jgi:hypothetical protein
MAGRAGQPEAADRVRRRSARPRSLRGHDRFSTTRCRPNLFPQVSAIGLCTFYSRGPKVSNGLPTSIPLNPPSTPAQISVTLTLSTTGPSIDAYGWCLLHGAPDTPLTAGEFIYMNRTSDAAQKSPGRGRPGLLPPCRRAGPTGECASLGDITMQPIYCSDSTWIAIYI